MADVYDELGPLEDDEDAPSPRGRPAGGEGDDDGMTHEGVTISEDMIMKGVSKADTRRGAHETLDTYLARLTHLTLNGKNIGHIDHLAYTPGVRVLYLYDNVIRRLQGFDDLTKLTHLYLQNNLIERITGLDRLVNLAKLYLDGNRISYVDGLEKCGRLEELHVSGQRLGPSEELRFNPGCMEAVGTSLMVLNAAGSKVRDAKPLMELLALRRLDLSKCKIESIRDIEPVLVNCRHLVTLDVRGCPIAKNPKHREHVTLLSESLTMLNDRDIKPHERKFLVQLQTRRMQKRAAATSQQQVQDQHLETIANLGAGTVDHGFDGHPFGSSRASPTGSNFSAASPTNWATGPVGPSGSVVGGLGGGMSELTLQVPDDGMGGSGYGGGMGGARSPRSGGGMGYYGSGALSPRRGGPGGSGGRVGGLGFGSSAPQRVPPPPGAMGSLGVGGVSSAAYAGGAKITGGLSSNQENMNHRYGGSAVNRPGPDTTSRFEVPDE